VANKTRLTKIEEALFFARQVLENGYDGTKPVDSFRVGEALQYIGNAQDTLKNYMKP